MIVEALLVLFFLAVITLIGLYVYRHRHTKSTATTPTTAVTASNSSDLNTLSQSAITDVNDLNSDITSVNAALNDKQGDLSE